ncbi:unnamed protein product [Rotaria socialis]|uniref:Uncharacterized protein n=1 Tax=Rotaria socialis TaxID=392032 RepID=A0A818KYV1_9BILA|nr:unnamed protein product [Rotaria socialis]CAF3312818.1 unnamed protein product [Rotaria socialis]CAF3551198.1 unnamed protein product [Rotaria socialis]CAF3568412.1 unnamed protein product [Rotaria socialis]CAF3754430.1 unnamed protein product [Rotaria socialis]
MLSRFIYPVVYNQQCLAKSSSRLLHTSVIRFTDGDHHPSKALDKAVDDLKTRKVKKWLDTVASSSEAIIHAERQSAEKQGYSTADFAKLQRDTIAAIKEKETNGYLLQHDDDDRQDQASRRSNP